MNKQNNIREVLSKHQVIPVVTFNSLDEVGPKIEMLLSRNVNCIEITLRTAIAYDAIKKVLDLYGDKMTVGMGTVVLKEHIDAAVDLGIDFIVSPGLNIGLADDLEKSGIAFIPGVATPSDIISGLQFGWDTFKFFPAHLFGGIEALKTYGQVFPSLKFCPTGGITEETHKDYLALNNVISVGGSWIK
jgi:2-dehydro-3-deoxyphosphogluconate aldolase/(4S)-4-hydroxy-2-oxoglutarate aldolase